MRVLAGLIAGLGAVGAAHGADLTDPVWAQAPGRSDWAKVYPAHAAQAGITGSVKLRCGVTAAGLLQNCAVVSESPLGEGFGAAALSLSAGMTLRPVGADGNPVDGRELVVPVKFDPSLLRPGAVVKQVDWLRRPSAEELERSVARLDTAGGGRVQITCIVTNRGLVEGCKAPPLKGSAAEFASAALALTPLFIMRPMTVDGLPVGGSSVTIPLIFEPPGNLRGFPPDPGMLATPLWTAASSSTEVLAAYPRSAAANVAAAHVVFRCGVRRDGHLEECVTLSEHPAGMGFAVAARFLIGDFQLLPDAGLRKQGDVAVDIPFDLRRPGSPAPPIEIFSPNWINGPTPEIVAAHFPAAALQSGRTTGQVSLDCNVTRDGALGGCVVATEQPAGYGFGEAAQSLARELKLSRWTAEGEPVEGAHLTLPITFVSSSNTARAAPTIAR